MSNWEHVSSRLGRVEPATLQIAKEIYDAASAAGHEIWFMWGMGSSAEHRTGRALDLMVRNKVGGDWIRNYIWRNRARLRLRHVIWWQRITSTVVQPGVVRKMASRGNVTADHKDHIHVLYNPGAYQAPTQQSAPSTQQPKPSTPSRTNDPRHVSEIQRALKVRADGKWGPVTDERARRMRHASQNRRGWPNQRHVGFNVRDVQEVIGTTVDGVWGPLSQAALENWIRGFQRLLNVAVDGWWGPKTDGKFIQVRRRYLNNF